MTETQALLRQLLAQIQAAGLPAPECDVRFLSPSGGAWVWDFVWPAARLFVDLGPGAPERRTQDAHAAGWRVLLLSADQVRSGAALVAIDRLLVTPPPGEQ